MIKIQDNKSAICGNFAVIKLQIIELKFEVWDTPVLYAIGLINKRNYKRFK